MKYKVGDKVRVREDLVEYNSYGGDTFVRSMSKYKGTVVTIDMVDGRGYYIKEDDESWHFTDKMLLPIESEEVGQVPDMVNAPPHYRQYRVEVIDIIEDATKDLKGIEAVCIGNVLKYVLRYKFKNGVQDLKKARFYLDKVIGILE